MRRIESCVRQPHKCAVFPQLGGDHPKGYFDTGNELPGWDDHVYVSVEAVEVLARELGWVPPGEQAEMVERLAEAQARNDRLEGELADQDTVLQAIDVLESKDFRARRKPGRKPVVRDEAA